MIDNQIYSRFFLAPLKSRSRKQKEKQALQALQQEIKAITSLLGARHKAPSPSAEISLKRLLQFDAKPDEELKPGLTLAQAVNNTTAVMNAAVEMFWSLHEYVDFSCVWC